MRTTINVAMEGWGLDVNNVVGRLMVLLALGWTGSASATLIDLGDGTVTDTFSGLLWTQQASLAGGAVQYDPSIAAVNALNVSSFAGVTSWRLASYSELSAMYDQLSEVQAIFNGDFTSFTPYFTSFPPYGDVGRLVQGYRFDNNSTTTLVRAINTGYAWAVTDNWNPAPAPATFALFSIGLAGLGWSRRKKV